MSDFTDDQLLALEVVSITLSCISFLCDALIIFSFYKFKQLRKFAYSFVFYIAVANIMREFAKMWGAQLETGTFACSLQAFLINYGGLSSFWWIANIAIVMYTMIFISRFWDITSQQIEKRKTLFLAINFSIPLIFALIPLFTNSYGNVGGWCWILKRNDTDHVLRYLSYYAHLLIILILCVFVYVRIWLYLKKNLTLNEDDDENETNKKTSIHKMYARIKWYPLCLILGFGFAAFRRIIQSINNKPSPYSFAIIQAITTGSFGILILCFYGRVGRLTKLYLGMFHAEDLEQNASKTETVNTQNVMTETVKESDVNP